VTALRAGPVDVRHLGFDRFIGSYLIETEEGLALFDCGPTISLDGLRSGLAEHGVTLDDVDHLLLSHIHLDHAGASGVIVREHPRIQVHVSEVGAPHLVDPSKLEASARRLYGDAFDAMWGALTPVPEANVHVVGDRVLGLECFSTPGHAWHHVSYLDDEGTLYSGDAAGVRLAPSSFVLPPLPPPEIDLDAWEQTIQETEARSPSRLALVHFGVFDDVEAHLGRLRDTIHRWSEWVGHGMDEATFSTAVDADVSASDPDDADHYLTVVPAWHAYRGLERYWRKRREAAGGA
jgi:glyoxylase-like metal-dependent hydrolase (beta-lactamase superfamily II)